MNSIKHVVLLLLIWGQSLTGWTALEPYNKESFEKNLQSNKKVLLHYHAAWCPVCKKQKVILSKLSDAINLKEVKFIAANYDLEKELCKKYKVTSQSVIILFENGKEIGRQEFETDKDVIGNFVNRLAKK